MELIQLLRRATWHETAFTTREGKGLQVVKSHALSSRKKKPNGCNHFLTIQCCVYHSKYFSLSKGDQLWFDGFFITKVDRSSLLEVLHLLSSSQLNTTNIHLPESYKTQAGRDYILLTELMHKVELSVCFKYWEKGVVNLYQTNIFCWSPNHTHFN